MKGSIVNISGRECHLYKNSNAEFLLVQPIDEHDLEVLGQEVEIIKELSDKPFTLDKGLESRAYTLVSPSSFR